MTRNPALRPIGQAHARRDFCASLKRIAFTAAAGFAALFITAAIWIR